MAHFKRIATPTGYSGNKTIYFEGDNKNEYAFSFSENFVHNCQLCAIGGIEGLLECVRNDNDVLNILVEGINEINTEQPLVFIDISTSYIKRIENCFPSIKYIQKYTSTNGNERANVLIDLSNFIDMNNNDVDYYYDEY